MTEDADHHGAEEEAQDREVDGLDGGQTEQYLRRRTFIWHFTLSVSSARTKQTQYKTHYTHVEKPQHHCDSAHKYRQGYTLLHL